MSPPKKLTHVSGVAPSFWAGYLLNGDASGLTAEEQAKADEFGQWLGGRIVGCEDAGFRWQHDATQFEVAGGDCQLYSALVESEEG